MNDSFLKTDIMRFSVLIALTLLCLAVHAAQHGPAVYIFDTKVYLPSSCILFANPAMTDGDISYSCHLDHSHDVLSIHLLKAPGCQGLTNQKYEGRTVQIVDNEEKFEYKNRIYLAQKITFSNGNVIYVKAIKDDQYCIFAMSGNKAEVEKALKPLWSTQVEAEKSKDK